MLKAPTIRALSVRARAVRPRPSSRKSWSAWLKARVGETGDPINPNKRVQRRPAVVRCVEPSTVAIPAIQMADVRVAPKPRQSQRDRWKPRDCVQRYRASGDELRLHRLKLPDTFVLVFYIAMPRSWSAKQRDAMRFQPHQSKPDESNLRKAVEDHLHPCDQRIYDGRGIKVWADADRLVIVAAKPMSSHSISPELIASWAP